MFDAIEQTYIENGEAVFLGTLSMRFVMKNASALFLENYVYAFHVAPNFFLIIYGISVAI